MTDELLSMAEQGLPEIPDGTGLAARTSRHATLHMRSMWLELGVDLGRLTSLHPHGAVEALFEELNSKGAELSVEVLLEHSTAADPDAVMPMMLGQLGLWSEKKRDVRRGAPGGVADAIHGHYALSSAAFLTADRRLALRLSAWAHHTGRGVGHRQSPAIFFVEPTAAGFSAAADAVRTMAEAFPELLRTVPRM